MIKIISQKTKFIFLITLFIISVTEQYGFAEKTIYDLFSENGITEYKSINYGAEKYVFKVKVGNGKLACLYFNPMLYNNSKYYMKELTFLKEAKKYKKENNKTKFNIIEYKGFLSDNYNYSIFTELAKYDLHHYIFKKKSEKAILTKLKILIDIANGIKYMHDLGYIHRDIKAKNIVIKNKIAKLIDFTMYKQIPNGETYVHTKRIKGSMDYICPEHIISQSRKQKLKIEPANDIYSFGVLIYSLLYEKYFDQDLMRKLIEDGFDQSRLSSKTDNKRFDNPEYRLAYLNYLINKKWRPSLDASIPETLNSLIQLCWNRKPEKRPTIDFITEKLITIKEKLLQESEEI